MSAERRLWRPLTIAALALAAACGPAVQPGSVPPESVPPERAARESEPPERALPGTGSVRLCWIPPSRNVDETQLTDLAGYRLYWGQSSGGPYPHRAEITDPSETSHVVEGLSDGEWYFVTTAVNADGLESDFSTELSKTVVRGTAVDCCCG